VWFFLLTAFALGSLLLLAIQLRREAGTRFAWLAPLAYLSLPVLICLQLGNFQVAALALAVIALVAIARGHELAGSALLAFVSLAKLFPLVLLILFLRRATLRPLALSVAWLAAWSGIAAVSFGWAPFEAFWSYHLPHRLDAKRHRMQEPVRSEVVSSCPMTRCWTRSVLCSPV
jgi:hypothetical protein